LDIRGRQFAIAQAHPVGGQDQIRHAKHTRFDLESSCLSHPFPSFSVAPNRRLRRPAPVGVSRPVGRHSTACIRRAPYPVVNSRSPFFLFLVCTLAKRTPAHLPGRGPCEDAPPTSEPARRDPPP